LPSTIKKGASGFVVGEKDGSLPNLASSGMQEWGSVRRPGSISVSAEHRLRFL
jgi:hypothetical protein